MTSDTKTLVLLGLVTGAAFVWSAINPHDRFTWFLEVLPVILAVPVLGATRRRFPLTTMVYVLIAVHAVILMVGGHYTYAEVPLFNWIRDTFGLARNDYDRIGHLAQGFIPAMIAREILLRRTPLRAGGWLFVIVTSVCLAISALYELIEWAVAAATGDSATAFLGTQGDMWDTQKDMFCAWIGAMAAQWLLAGWHNQQLQARGYLNS
jgi:putative membrane protein